MKNIGTTNVLRYKLTYERTQDLYSKVKWSFEYPMKIFYLKQFSDTNIPGSARIQIIPADIEHRYALCVKSHVNQSGEKELR